MRDSSRVGIALHPAFSGIHAEVHRFAYEPMRPPVRALFLLVQSPAREAEQAHLGEIAAPGANLEVLAQDTLRVAGKGWTLSVQRHVESTRYLFLRPMAASHPERVFADDPLEGLPRHWIARIPGRLLLALDLACLARGEDTDEVLTTIARRALGDRLAGGRVGRTASLVFASLRLEGTMERMLVFSGADTPARTGRLVGRLLDVQAYRTLALLGWPQARGLLMELPQYEQRLEAIVSELATGGQDEETLTKLLDLALEVERRLSQGARRFSATRAYFEVLERRLAELQERPVAGLPTWTTTLRRRLAGVRDTTEAVERWLAGLSRRTDALSDLLRTRVSVRQEAQQQKLLATMNRRFALQFRLQRTAELLSVAIFTYYASHILEDVATALGRLLGHTPENFGWVRALSAPLLAALAAWWLLRARKRAQALEEPDA